MCMNCALCSIPFYLICIMTTFSKKNVLTFDPTPGAEGVCKTEYEHEWCSMLHFHSFDMQKKCFDL